MTNKSRPEVVVQFDETKRDVHYILDKVKEECPDNLMCIYVKDGKIIVDGAGKNRVESIGIASIAMMDLWLND